MHAVARWAVQWGCLVSSQAWATEPCAEGFGRAADGNRYPVAIAAPAAEPADPTDRWQGVDKRARTVATAGWVAATAGLGIEVIGLVIPSNELVFAGSVGEVTGSPIIAGATIRSATALQHQGAPVSRGAGYAAWTMWGSGLAVNVGAALGLRIGSYAAGAAQAGANRRARASLGHASAQGEDRSASLTFTVRPDGTLLLAGSF